MGAEVRVLDAPGLWIDGTAVEQLETTARLDGVELAVGLPDLHPGRGHPIGAAFLSSLLYPHLVGSDIGCGMSLFRTGLSVRRSDPRRLGQRLGSLEEPVTAHGEDAALGTIGAGNHFAELQRITEVVDQDTVERLGLDAGELILLVHSGSRGFGQAVLDAHLADHGSTGVEPASVAGSAYLDAHDRAVTWARRNRRMIAERFADRLSFELADPVIDVCHNSVTPLTVEDRVMWLHRKGAAPATEGPVVIPGSRDAASYLCQPTGDLRVCGWSLAHGAGRKWSRSQARDKTARRHTAASLTRTEGGGLVICDDKNLLFEEAPAAYKPIDSVVGALVDHGCAQILAVSRPVLTYKTRRAETPGRR